MIIDYLIIWTTDVGPGLQGFNVTAFSFSYANIDEMWEVELYNK
jgi:hypothetical protein